VLDLLSGVSNYVPDLQISDMHQAVP